MPLGYFGDVSKANLVKDQSSILNAYYEVNKLIPVTDLSSH